MGSNRHTFATDLESQRSPLGWMLAAGKFRQSPDVSYLFVDCSFRSPMM